MDILDHFLKIQDSMFKKINKSFSKLNKGLSEGYKKPSCEISQGKDSLIIKFGLPGLDKKDIMINITHEILDILGEKKSKRSYKGERYRRIIPLPPGLVTDKTKAKFSKGSLIIKIPKVKIGKVRVK